MVTAENGQSSDVTVHVSKQMLPESEAMERLKSAQAEIDASVAGDNPSLEAVTKSLAPKTAYVKGEKITGSIETVPRGVPEITVSGGGLIAVEVDQEAGLVDGGTARASWQLPTRAAASIRSARTCMVATMGAKT